MAVCRRVCNVVITDQWSWTVDTTSREWCWVGRGGGGFRVEVPGYQGARNVHFGIITKY